MSLILSLSLACVQKDFLPVFVSVSRTCIASSKVHRGGTPKNPVCPPPPSLRRLALHRAKYIELVHRKPFCVSFSLVSLALRSLLSLSRSVLHYSLPPSLSLPLCRARCVGLQKELPCKLKCALRRVAMCCIVLRRQISPGRIYVLH